MRDGTFRLPEEQQEARRKAKRLAWLSILLIGSATVVLALAMGQSQAMKTAWVSDLLGTLPPMALLFAMRHELREPTLRFPFGYLRSISIAFLVTSATLTTAGVWLLLDSVLRLVHREHPPIGTVEMFGQQFWAGWIMIAALLYAVIIDVTLGRLKKPVAETLHDKVLEADAVMNRDDWLAQGAAVIGILLVGYGFWWGDATAAAIISIQLVRDGWMNVRQVIGDLMDEAPTKMGKRELEKLPQELAREAEKLPWARRAEAHLREHGHALTGEVFIECTEPALRPSQLEEAAEALERFDWRLHGLTVVPVEKLRKIGEGAK
jgi:cation diffusion facilitator family transporter